MKFLISIIIVQLLLLYNNTSVYAYDKEQCISCHGNNGQSIILNYPNLAGQNKIYLFKQMLAFKTGQRENPVMQAVTKNLTDHDMDKLAEFFAQQKPHFGTAKRALLKAGQLLYRGGNRQKGIPACMACHGPAGEGNLLAGTPSLAGQHANYTQTQLEAYRAKKRVTDGKGIMPDIAARLTDDDIIVLASYLEGLHRVH